jgi:hypothetical protein
MKFWMDEIQHYIWLHHLAENKAFLSNNVRMYSFFGLTDSKVMSAPLSVKNSVSSQEFSRLGAYFWSSFRPYLSSSTKIFLPLVEF